ncbi:unknown [Firmicutes bacterium CAG:102]|nr:unknown [Firmicutes bacterium CAG:102]
MRKGRETSPTYKINFWMLIVNIKMTERSGVMDMLYLGFKVLQAVFCVIVIVYIIKNWNR